MGVNWKFVFILSRQGSFRRITARFCSSLLVLAQYDSTFFFLLARWGNAFPPKGKGEKVLFLFLFGADSIFSA